MPPALPRSVGSFVVHPVVDLAGPIETTAHEAFPDATEEQWAATRAFDPAAFGSDDARVLPFRAFVLIGPDDAVTVVDLGVGTESSPAASWVPGRGTLPDGLVALGVSPTDVDLVVLTHLHEDHVGWVVGPDGLPLFTNAEHVAQATEVEAIAEDRVIRAATVDPLRAAELLREIDGPYALRPGIDVDRLPATRPVTSRSG